MALPFPCCSSAQCPWWVWTVVHLNCSFAPCLTQIQQLQRQATRRCIYFFLNKHASESLFSRGESPLSLLSLSRGNHCNTIFLSCQITQISTYFPASFSILLSSIGSPVFKILFRQPSQHFI